LLNGNSWGGSAGYRHDISRVTSASINLGYINYQELGGHAKSYNVDGEVDYTLGPHTNVYGRAGYYWRDSSQALQVLSPVTGSLDDFRLTVGLHYQL
jgi:predicted porin